MKIKVWCEKSFPSWLVLGGSKDVTIYNEKIIDFDLHCFDNVLGHSGYYYTNALYDYIHNEYKYVDVLTYDGSALEYQIIEEGYLDDIPYLAEPINSIEELEEKLKDRGWFGARKYCEEKQ